MSNYNGVNFQRSTILTGLFAAHSAITAPRNVVEWVARVHQRLEPPAVFPGLFRQPPVKPAQRAKITPVGESHPKFRHTILYTCHMEGSDGQDLGRDDQWG
jgi:hypothetical protein